MPKITRNLMHISNNFLSFCGTSYWAQPDPLPCNLAPHIQKGSTTTILCYKDMDTHMPPSQQATELSW